MVCSTAKGSLSDFILNLYPENIMLIKKVLYNIKSK